MTRRLHEEEALWKETEAYGFIFSNDFGQTWKVPGTEQIIIDERNLSPYYQKHRENNMVYVKAVRSNLKSGCDLEFETPHVYLHGPNASGKTTILQAISLALTGSASDLSVRDTARDGKLLVELGRHDETLYAEVELSNGETAHWEYRAGSKVEHTKPSLPVHFLMDEVEEALTGSKDRATLFFFKHFVNDATVNAKAVHEYHAQLIVNEPDMASEIATCLAASQEQGAAAWLGAYALAKDARSAAGTERLAIEKALRFLPAADTFNENASKAAIAAALVDVLHFQTSGGYKKCAICGTEQHTEIYRNRLERAEIKLEEFGGRAIQGDAERTKTLMLAKAEATDRENALSKVEHALMAVMYRCVQIKKPEIEKRVNEFLPGPPSPMARMFGIRSTDKILIAGIRSGEQVRPAASGAEWVMILAAVSAAIARAIKGICVIVLPDRALDSDSLRAALRHFKTIPASVFIQSPYWPTGRPHLAWHRVNTGPEVEGTETHVTAVALPVAEAPAPKKRGRPKKVQAAPAKEMDAFWSTWQD